METSADYYSLLGVGSDASPGEIKIAFKKLALRYHPDVYQGEDAPQRMRDLLLAYQTLKNPQSRQEYDARHQRRQPVATASKQPPKAKERSSSETFEHQRIYAFPEFLPARGMLVDLQEIIYHLTAREAGLLIHEGLLRGVRSEAKPGDYYCHRCSYHWSVGVVRQRSQQPTIPRFCPNCRATDWPEYLLLRCEHCEAVFESEQLRYSIGSVVYGRTYRGGEQALCHPYELFPLCPYCRRSHWCPAEETRIEAIQEQKAKQAMIWRIVWGSIIVVCLLFLIVLIINQMH